MLRLRPAAAVARLQRGPEAESWNSGLKGSEKRNSELVSCRYCYCLTRVVQNVVIEVFLSIKHVVQAGGGGGVGALVLLVSLDRIREDHTDIHHLLNLCEDVS